MIDVSLSQLDRWRTVLISLINEARAESRPVLRLTDAIGVLSLLREIEQLRPVDTAGTNALAAIQEGLERAARVVNRGGARKEFILALVRCEIPLGNVEQRVLMYRKHEYGCDDPCMHNAASSEWEIRDTIAPGVWTYMYCPTCASGLFEKCHDDDADDARS